MTQSTTGGSVIQTAGELSNLSLSKNALSHSQYKLLLSINNKYFHTLFLTFNPTTFKNMYLPYFTPLHNYVHILVFHSHNIMKSTEMLSNYILKIVKTCFRIPQLKATFSHVYLLLVSINIPSLSNICAYFLAAAFVAGKTPR